MEVWSFFGERQHRALTQSADETGLPTDLAPWVRFKRVQLSDSDDGDRAAMDAIRASGFYLYRGG